MGLHFKKALACVSLVAMSGVVVSSPGMAADLDAKAAPILSSPVKFRPRVSARDWSGAYVGVQAGGAFQRSLEAESVTSPAGVVAPLGFEGDDAGGFLGGLHAGYNIQSGRFVYGFEIDSSGTTLTSEFDDVTDSNLRALSSARLRVGYTFDRFLPYVTGGVGIGVNNFQTDAGFDNSGVHVGWQAGAGLEYSLSDRLSGRLQYTFTSLGSRDVSIDAGGPVTAVTEVDPGNIQTLTAGFSFNTSGLINRRGRR